MQREIVPYLSHALISFLMCRLFHINGPTLNINCLEVILILGKYGNSLMRIKCSEPVKSVFPSRSHGGPEMGGGGQGVLSPSSVA